jgi:hypothetical protein
MNKEHEALSNDGVQRTLRCDICLRWAMRVLGAPKSGN